MLDTELQKINYLNLLFLNIRRKSEKKNTNYNIPVVNTGASVVFQKEEEKIEGRNEKMAYEIDVYVY